MTVPDDRSAALAKVMRLRYAGACDRCDIPLAVGTRAAYLRATRSVRCLTCLERVDASRAEPPAPVDPGRAGSSARREYEKRVARREERIRTAHPHLGGMILALTDEPQSTTAWARGARGEAMLGARLDSLAPKGVRVLHDRRIPGSRANIDHIALAPTGGYVIDTKRYRGRVDLRVDGGLFRPRVGKLLVGSRNCTRLIDGVHRQVDLVGQALDEAGLTAVPVRGVLCFVEAEWPLIGGAFRLSSVLVAWPRRVARVLTASGPLPPAEIERAHRALDRAFPAA